MGLFVDVLGGPQFGERLACYREFADEVGECCVSGTAAGGHPQDADRGAGRVVPIWVNLGRSWVEEDLPGHVALRRRQFREVGDQRSGQVVPGEDVATVVHDHRGRVVDARHCMAQRRPQRFSVAMLGRRCGRASRCLGQVEQVGAFGGAQK